MQVQVTVERETEHTVRFAGDEAGQPERHPGAPVLEALCLQKCAGAQLGKPGPLAVSVEALEPSGAP